MRLGEHKIDLDRGIVSRKTEEIHISPRAAAVLADLIHAEGKVVLTEDLIERHWRAEVTTPNSVHKAINELRAALRDDAKNPQYIETIPKRGYRLRINRPPEEVVAHSQHRKPRWQIPLLMIGMLSAGLVAVWLRAPSPESDADFRGAVPTPIARLTVEPFQPIGSDPQLVQSAASLSEGVTAELAGLENRILLVDRPTSADYELTGSVDTNGTAVSVTMRVLRLSDGVVIWSETHDDHLHNLSALRAGHAKSIARMAGNMAFHDVLPYQTNEQAKRYFKRAMQEFVAWSLGRESDWTIRTRYLKLAAQADPEFQDPVRMLTLAYIQRLGMSISWAEAKDEADTYLARSIAMAPDECMTFFLRGQAAYSLDLNYALSIEAFETARAKCPVLSGLIDLQMAFLHRQMGDFHTALEFLHTAHRGDTGHDQVFLFTAFALVLIDLGRYTEAVDYLDQAWEVSGKLNSFSVMLIVLNRARACGLSGDKHCAQSSLDLGWSRFGNRSPHWFPDLFAMTGDVQQARSILSDMEEAHAAGKWVLAAEAFRGYLYLGELDSAFDWLDRAIDDRQSQVITQIRSPRNFTQLHSDHRFQDALARLREMETYPR
jgi:DNA-binding winged helix-turn-helix (wHTH) protein/tetratricopeptide (TPR) repeat protein